MSVQSAVERMPQEWWRDPDGLAFRVQEAWQNLPENTICQVFDRIPIVLQLIVNCGGDNTNVEERHGHHGAAVVAVPLTEWIKKIWEKWILSRCECLVRDTYSCESDSTNNKQLIILTALDIADGTSKPVTAPRPCGLGFWLTNYRIIDQPPDIHCSWKSNYFLGVAI
jgi:hypothetical protein